VDIRRAADNVPSTSSSDETTLKFYDRSYFDRWYREPDDRVATRESLERKARMVISLTEFLIGRRIRSVLDVGCGEAPWYPIVKRLRPQARYIGVDSSDYVLERFGVSRNIRRGTLATLGAMRLPKRIDMIVCADVLQYAPDAEIVRGLRAIRQLLGGVAYIEAFVSDDNMEGDRVGWHERTAAEYSRFFRDAGLTQCGPYAFMSLDELDSLNRFEHL
jgi:SAM-dependent methyltransferase